MILQDPPWISFFSHLGRVHGANKLRKILREKWPATLDGGNSNCCCL